MKIRINSKRVISVAAVLLMLITLGTALGARRTTDQPVTEESPGLAMQFGQSFACMFTECGWPTIIILVLPAIAVWFYTRFIHVF